MSGFRASVRALTPVYVSTAAYVRSHGRPPRGRGCWAFFFGNQTRIEDAWFAPGGEQPYSQAKKAAIAEARERGFTLVEVGS